MSHVPFWGPANDMCRHIKFCILCDLEPLILCVWSVTVSTEKLWYMGAINWSYMQTWCCIPIPCHMIGEGDGCLWLKTPVSQVWGLTADRVTGLRTRYWHLQCPHLGLTQACLPSKVLSREQKKRRLWICTCCDLVKLAEGSELS
jgi:hypothetical protein